MKTQKIQIQNPKTKELLTCYIHFLTEWIFGITKNETYNPDDILIYGFENLIGNWSCVKSNERSIIEVKEPKQALIEFIAREVKSKSTS